MSGRQTIHTRRVFLHRAARFLGSAFILPFATHCTQLKPTKINPSDGPTIIPSLLPSLLPPNPPTATIAPTNTPASVRGTLVRAQSPTFWEGDSLSPSQIRLALDTSVTELTNVRDARKAWATLFKPGERVAIKVNAISFGATNPILVTVVTQCLMDIGIRAEDITLYDRSSDELKNAGFAVNSSSSGIRCRGNDSLFTEVTWSVADVSVRMSRIVEECDAIINMPVLKGFSIGGISFALKNHYGSIENPSRFHDNRFAPGVTGINASPPIKGKTRLIIGDILSKETHADWTDYAVLGNVNTLLVGFDPLTVDTVGLDMALKGLSAKGLNTRAIESQVKGWLITGESQDLGVGVLDHIDIKEIRI